MGLVCHTSSHCTLRAYSIIHMAAALPSLLSVSQIVSAVLHFIRQCLRTVRTGTLPGSARFPKHLPGLNNNDKSRPRSGGA